MSKPKKQFDELSVLLAAKELGIMPRDICTNCLKEIQVMAFRGTGVCCELCRKDRDGDHSKNHAIIEAPVGGERAEAKV